jgi:hypothetical protein
MDTHSTTHHATDVTSTDKGEDHPPHISPYFGPLFDGQNFPEIDILPRPRNSSGKPLIRCLFRFGRSSQDIEERGLDDPLPTWFRRWRGDGVILRSASRTLLISAVDISVLRPLIARTP